MDKVNQEFQTEYGFFTCRLIRETCDEFDSYKYRFWRVAGQ